jgi:membrane protein DedA with SNARE-associated domain
VVAGVVNMPWWRFLAFNATGAVVWSTVFTGLGYLAGEHINSLYAKVQRYEAWIFVVMGLAVVVFAVRYLLRRHRRHSTHSPDATH